tara:strand:+ start:4106 stop:6064 length:1959 start_codon:yes stop_codon:yes gene_type:complete
MSTNEISTNFYIGQDLINTSSNEYKEITTSKKIAFTDGSNFKLNGNNYTGYYNSKNTIFYKTKNSQQEELTIIENINTDVIKSKKFFDRTIYNPLNPSYTLDDIIFKPNEIINKNSINFKLNLLYENFIDLYRFNNIKDPLVPDTFDGYAVLSGTEWEWVASNKRFISGGLDPSLTPVSGYNIELTNANNINTVAVKSTKTLDEFSLFVSTSSYLFAYQLDENNTKFEFVLSADGLGIQNDLRFLNVTSIAADKEKDILYINDRDRQQVFKTNIRSIVNKDRTGVREIKLLNTIGGEGSSQTNLTDNTYVEYGDSNVYVFDKANGTIKKFSDEFVYKTQYANTRFFTENEFASMTYNQTFNLLYVLTKNFIVVVLDANNLNQIDKYTYTKNPFEFEIPLIGAFEEARKVIFSENDSNIYYLQSNKNIYKYFVNSQNELIERFTIDITFDSVALWNTIFNEFSAYEVVWDDLPDFDKFTIAAGGLNIIGDDIENQDKLILWTNNRVMSFKETNDTVSLLNTTAPNFYEKSEIFIKNELFNNITINSTFYRHLFNLNLLSSNLNKQILAEFDTVLTKGYLRFKDFIELSYEDKKDLDLNDQKQYFIGVNETLNGNTLNRVFTNIFNYQNKLIKIVKTLKRGERIPPSKTVLLDK